MAKETLGEVEVIEIPSLILRDRQAFVFHQGVKRLVGNPVLLAKRLAPKVPGIHFFPEDPHRALQVLDPISYHVRVQVELPPNPDLIWAYGKISARMVLPKEGKFRVPEVDPRPVLILKAQTPPEVLPSGFSEVLTSLNSPWKRPFPLNFFGEEVPLFSAKVWVRPPTLSNLRRFL